jgi:hypothetical protein
MKAEDLTEDNLMGDLGTDEPQGKARLVAEGRLLEGLLGLLTETDQMLGTVEEEEVMAHPEVEDLPRSA